MTDVETAQRRQDEALRRKSDEREAAQVRRRQQLEERIDALREDYESKRVAASAAQARANFCVDAVAQLHNQHRIRVDDVHRGIDGFTGRAVENLRAKLWGELGTLSRGNGPQDLRGLTSLWIATRPEFAATLHELVDGEPPHGHEGLSRITPEEFAAEKAELKQAAEKAQRVAVEAAGIAKAASEVLRRFETGRLPA